MRKLRTRRLATVAASSLLAISGVLAISSPAQAVNGTGGGDGFEWVEWDTAHGHCKAEVVYSDSYAAGYYENISAGYDCTFWIERSADGGYTWPSVFDKRVVSPTATYGTTYNVLDSSAYLARACFHFNFSGAAKHCSLLV